MGFEGSGVLKAGVHERRGALFWPARWVCRVLDPREEGRHGAS